MNDISFLAIKKCLNDLCDYHFCCILWEVLDSAQALKEVSVLAVFEHRVDAAFVIEISIQTDNIGLVEPPLYLKFFLELGEKIKFFQRSLADNF